ncbi:hypothetical protein [Corynebacterium kalidii]
MIVTVTRENRLRAEEMRLWSDLEKLDIRGGLFLGSTWSNEAIGLAWELGKVHEEMECLSMRPLAMEEDHALAAV